MKVFAFCQVYNEALFIKKNLQNTYPVVDKIILSEGRLTPHGNLPEHSPDGTLQIIREFIQGKDKCHLLDLEETITKNSREASEGVNKNCMLKLAECVGLEENDLIMIGDCDEFIEQESLQYIINYFKNHTECNHAIIEEYQFAYNLNYWFPSSHGRFFRYKPGSYFKTTNHFCHPNGKDLSQNADVIFTREEVNFYHLCWVYNPIEIRNKVISFSRPSFIQWFNKVYLQWPFDQEGAYLNNSRIPPYHGKGFAEGMDSPLKTFEKIPELIAPLDPGDKYLEYIRQHHNELLIK